MKQYFAPIGALYIEISIIGSYDSEASSYDCKNKTVSRWHFTDCLCTTKAKNPVL